MLSLLLTHFTTCPLLSHVSHVQPSFQSVTYSSLRQQAKSVHGQVHRLHMPASCAPAYQALRARVPAPRQRAARPPPPPQRAPQRVLGAPGHIRSISKASWAGRPLSDTAAHHYLLFHAATCMACTAAPRSFAQTVHRCRPGQHAASVPVAAHAQPAARLLIELRALERSRCGKLLLGCCLRLSARLAHLGKFLRSAGIAHVGKTSLTARDQLSSASLCPMLLHLNGACSRVIHRPTRPHSAEPSLGRAALPHCRTDSMSCTCLFSSARSSASAAANRSSAAASASARALAHAWCT